MRCKLDLLAELELEFRYIRGGPKHAVLLMVAMEQHKTMLLCIRIVVLLELGEALEPPTYPLVGGLNLPFA